MKNVARWLMRVLWIVGIIVIGHSLIFEQHTTSWRAYQVLMMLFYGVTFNKYVITMNW